MQHNCIEPTISLVPEAVPNKLELSLVTCTQKFQHLCQSRIGLPWAWLPWLPEDKSCLRQLTLAEVLIRYQTEPKGFCQFQGEESPGIPLQLYLQAHD